METTGKKHTKNLDTLVDDINDILVGISSGKAPDDTVVTIQSKEHKVMNTLKIHSM